MVKLKLFFIENILYLETAQPYSFILNYIWNCVTIRLQRYFLWQFSLKGQAVGLLQNLHLAGCIWQTKPCTRAIRPLGAT